MFRHARVLNQIKREISNILHDDLKDPRIGFITVTRIELSLDLRYAKIYYSVLGNEEQRVKTSEALKNACGFIRKLLTQRLDLKFSPEIFFKEDSSIEEGFKVFEELDKLKDNRDDEENNSSDKDL
jgi:ribosome-binding factor A